MMAKRIKVFLGGYVNFLNAQNINCRALSEHLDKERFEVWTMTFWYQDAHDFKKLPGVHYLHSYRPVRFLGWLPYFIGLLRCDVAFLPKGEYWSFCSKVAKLFGCEVFYTLEGILDDVLLGRQANPEKLIAYYRNNNDNLYAITKFIKDRESRYNSINTKDKILYLGVDSKRFLISQSRVARPLGNIVFIGNDLIRKECNEFLKLAQVFPTLKFHVIGGKQLSDGTLEAFLEKNEITNVKYHGSLDHSQMALVLQDMDLMFFPSRSEGFPKVMLETACAGVPTLCYNDYGADEWITTGKDGFVVKTFDEAVAVVKDLQDHPDKLPALSRNAVELGKRFDWSILVKDWEQVIEAVYNGKKV